MDFNDGNTKSEFTVSDVYLPKEELKVAKDSDDVFENLNVVCTSGGCNKTKTHESPNNTSKDTISADILVHIKTKIGVDKSSKNNSVEDVPDIPVIVGYGGISESERNNNYNSDNNIVLSKGRESSKNFYIPSQSHVKEIPPVVVPISDSVKYKQNGIGLQVPYFEPAYNNHYFGEKPLQQYAWYVKPPGSRPEALNQYRGVNSNRAGLYGIPQGHYHYYMTTPPGSRPCNCQKPDYYQVYAPNVGRRFNGQTNVKIDDKLAPLE